MQRLPLQGWALSCLLGLGAVSACVSVSEIDATLVPPGLWGGDRASLLIDAAGARIEFDCGAASLEGPLKSDAQGRFASRGEYEDVAGGPQPGDAPPSTRAARFEGRITGDILDLSMHVADDPVPRRYRMIRGQRIKLVRCL